MLIDSGSDRLGYGGQYDSTLPIGIPIAKGPGKRSPGSPTRAIVTYTVCFNPFLHKKRLKSEMCVPISAPLRTFQLHKSFNQLPMRSERIASRTRYEHGFPKHGQHPQQL